MSSAFVFVHPQFLTRALLPDDSIHYALLTYDRNAMSNAVVTIMKSIQSSHSLPPLDTKKRIKVIMEIFAVTLTLPIEHVDLMTIAIKQYLLWLEDSSIFGDKKRQNKYLRRVIGQMSLPFVFREPRDVDIFKGPFFQLLIDIFNGLQLLFSTRGTYLEKETWVLIFQTLIGMTDIVIKFEFGKFLPVSQISELRQLATKVLFSCVLTSGIKDEEFWGRFVSSTISWSGNLDFLKVWDRHVIMLFSFVNSRAYKLPVLLANLEPDFSTNNYPCSAIQRPDLGDHENAVEEPLQSGIYSSHHLIDTKTVVLLFTRFVRCLDFHQTIVAPANYLEFNQTLSTLVKKARLASFLKSTSSFLKFPAASFLKLFGGMLTFAPALGNEFDPAVSLNVDTLSAILAHFDPSGVLPVTTRIAAYIVKRSLPSHPEVFSAFISFAPSLFGLEKTSTAGFADFSVRALAQFKAPSTSLGLRRAMTSLFISSCEVLSQVISHVPDAHSSLEPSFNRVWGVAEENPLHFALLCYASSRAELPFLPRCQEVLTNFQQFLNASPGENSRYMAALMSFMGAALRFHPELMAEFNGLHILPLVVNGIMSLDEKSEYFSRLVTSGCHLVIDLIDYTNAFENAENIDSFFKFTLFLSKGVHDGRRRSSTTLLTASWYEKNHHYVEALLSYLTIRINNHVASADHSTRRYGSSRELNEQRLMKEMKLDVKHYFTVGKDLLVSFLERKDGTGPMAIFARGPFGKSLWKVQDDFVGSRPPPEKSNDCKPCTLPPAADQNVTPLNLRGEDFTEAPAISIGALQGFDEALRAKFGADFAKWLNWDVYGNYTPFGHREPYHRRRVADFLATMGLVDAHNKLNVQAHKDTPELQEIIERFDKIDNWTVKPVIVTLHLPADTSLEAPGDRMTPTLQAFLREIGEPMDFSKKEDFPKMRTTVPVIAALNSFVAVLTPAMGADEESRRTIADCTENALVRVIFNESGFELNMRALRSEYQEDHDDHNDRAIHNDHNDHAAHSDHSTHSDHAIPSSQNRQNAQNDQNGALFPERQTVLIVAPLGSSLYKVEQVHSYAEILSPFGPVQTLSARSLAFNLSIVMQMTNSLASKKAFVNVTKQRKSTISEICPDSNTVPEFGGLISERFE